MLMLIFAGSRPCCRAWPCCWISHISAAPRQLHHCAGEPFSSLPICLVWPTLPTAQSSSLSTPPVLWYFSLYFDLLLLCPQWHWGTPGHPYGWIKGGFPLSHANPQGFSKMSLSPAAETFANIWFPVLCKAVVLGLNMPPAVRVIGRFWMSAACTTADGVQWCYPSI